MTVEFTEVIWFIALAINVGNLINSVGCNMTPKIDTFALAQSAHNMNCPSMIAFDMLRRKMLAGEFVIKKEKMIFMNALD